jgi:hypothetical protein
MAFQPHFVLDSFIFDSFLNLMFLADILVNFISAFYDEEFNIIDDYRVRNEYKFIL